MTLALREDQLVGARFLAAKERAGLFDEPGFGKTAQVIAALDAVKAKRVLIVGPAKAHKVGVWQGEFKKFATTPRRILRGRGIQDLNLWLRGRADVLLLSYEMALKWTKHLEGDLVDAIVFDESHRLKTYTAQRTRAMLGYHCDAKQGLARWGAHVWFLTGTPMAKSPIDIWTTARFCGATTLTHRLFCDRYFRQRITAYGTRYTPRENMLPELRMMIDSFSLRRLTQGLPPLWITSLSLEGDTAEVRSLLAGYPGLEQQILEAVQQGGLSKLNADHIATLRRLVGEAKAPVYAELLVEELQDNPGKRVVMGWHKKAIAIVKSHLDAAGIDCVMVTGSTSERGDEEAVRRFQADPNCRVFLGNLLAAGEAVTLTAADHIDLFEQSWSPKDNAQAIKRIHRTGQDKSCRARMIVLADSIDERVAEVVRQSSAAIAKVQTASVVSAPQKPLTPAPMFF